MGCMQVGSIKAQDWVNPNQVTISLGSVQGLVKDELYSPLNYKSDGGTLGLNYQKLTKKRHLFAVDIELQTLEIKTNVSEFFIADQVKLNIEIAYLISISSSKNSRLFVGPDLHSNGALINFEDDFTLSNSGTFVSHRGLGAQVLHRSRFKKNTIHIHGKLPLVGKVYRSPYNLFTKDLNDEQLFSFLYTNGELSTVHNYFNPSVATTISRPLFRNIHFTAGYELNYLYSSVNKSITNYQGRFIFATIFKF